MRGRLIVLGTAALSIPWSIVRATGLMLDPGLMVFLSGLAVFSAALLFALTARMFRNLAGPPWIRVIAEVLPALPFLLMVSRLSSSTTLGVNGVSAAVALATGTNLLVAGIAIPLVVASFTLRYRRQGATLDRPKLVDLTVLGFATLYTLVPVAKQRFDLFDGVIYMLLFIDFLFASTRFRLPALGSGPVEELLATLPAPNRLVTTFALIAYGLFAMFLSSGAFAEGLVQLGSNAGDDGSGSMQWIGPLVALGPAILLAVYTSFRGSHQRAMGDMLSLKLVLAIAAYAFIPLGNATGTGNFSPLPLDAQQVTQLLLATTQGIFLIVVLLTLAMTQIDALIIALLFLIQVLIPDPIVRQVFVVGYVVMSIASLALDRRKLGVLRLAPRLTWGVLRNNSAAIHELQAAPAAPKTEVRPTVPGTPPRRNRKQKRRK